jgi:hypothetical protein
MAGDGRVGFKTHDHRPEPKELPDDIFPAIVIGSGDRYHRFADRLKQMMEDRAPIGGAVAEILKLIDDLPEGNLPFRNAQT